MTNTQTLARLTSLGFVAAFAIGTLVLALTPSASLFAG